MSAAAFVSDPGTLAAAFLLVLLRTGALVAVCPILGAEILPAPLRAAIAVALAAMLTPLVAVPAQIGASPASLVPLAAREIAVGFGLGIAARALFAGIEGAASLVAGQAGFSVASMFDPLSGEQGLALTLFQNMLASAVFLAADLHHVFVRALAASYDIVPVASGLPATAGLEATVGLLGARLFDVAVELAAPALVVTVAVDLVLALAGRAVPQMQVMTVGYPLKMAAGLVATAVLALATGNAIPWIGRVLASDGSAVMAALAGK